MDDSETTVTASAADHKGNEHEATHKAPITVASADEEDCDETAQNKAPVTVAGGWQGLDIVNQEKEEQEEGASNDNETTKAVAPCRLQCLARLATRYPRTYHIVAKILLPLFVIIMLCFLCGAILVNLESDQEIKSNDQALGDIAIRISRINEIAQAARMSPVLCLESYQGDLTNRTNLEQHMHECGQSLPDRVEETVQELTDEQESNVFGALTFNWITCGDDRAGASQTNTVQTTWEADLQTLQKEYQAQGMSEIEAKKRAFTEAQGHVSCEENYGAGALFWLTIATTIGYGNVVPVTPGGRALVYTLGFISILIFTALIGQAGYVCVVIADDFFIRCRMKRLVDGVVAAFFWLAVLCIWLLVIAGVAMSYTEKRTNGLVSAQLNNAFWFSFVSISTVGMLTCDFQCCHVTILSSHCYSVG